MYLHMPVRSPDNPSPMCVTFPHVFITKVFWATVVATLGVGLTITLLRAQGEEGRIFLPVLANEGHVAPPTVAATATVSPTGASTPSSPSVTATATGSAILAPTATLIPMPTGTSTATATATPSPTPSSPATATAIATASATSSTTPTASPTPTGTIGVCQTDPDPAAAPDHPVRIVTVVKDANPEVVRLRNASNTAVDLTGWRMCSIKGNQEHDGIGGFLAPNETKGFPYTGSGPIWNNAEQDDGALYNAAGQLVSYWIDPN